MAKQTCNSRPTLELFSISYQIKGNSMYVLKNGMGEGKDYTYPATPTRWYMGKEKSTLEAALRSIKRNRAEFGKRFLQAQVHKTILYQDDGTVSFRGRIYHWSVKSAEYPAKESA